MNGRVEFSPGTAGWRPNAGDPLAALYERVLSQTGSRETAERAVQNAQGALDQVFHNAMVQNGGDEAGARAVQSQHSATVLRLAELVPSIQSSDAGRAGPALSEAMRLFQGAGLGNAEWMYGWLNQNVADDGVLRGAGLDPEAVRRPPDSPWSHADRESLLGLVSDMLERYRTTEGQPLSREQIDGYLDQARAAAERYGVGNARVAGSTTPPPAGTVSVAAFSFPRRV